MSNPSWQDRTLAGPLQWWDAGTCAARMFDGCTVQNKFPELYNYKKNGISIKISDMVVSRFEMALPRLFLLFAQSS